MGCELLSKIIIFVMKDSKIKTPYTLRKVVNCFQKLLSSWWRTACRLYWTYGKTLWIAFKNYYLRDEGQPAVWCSNECIWLWIAFKNYYLRDEGQHKNTTLTIVCSCELLSKIIIFVMKDSQLLDVYIDLLVVNCFQKLLSSWWRTAEQKLTQQELALWIAFKNYYLRDEGQLLLLQKVDERRCELLSKIIIFVMKDSYV